MIRMNRSLFAHLFCAAAAAVGLHDYAFGEEVKESFLAEGVTAKMGGYRPIRAEMDQEAGIITKAPEGLTAPKYGYIEFGDKKWAFVLEEPAEGDAKLFIDSNGDGDVTNDPAAEWNAREQNGQKMYNGTGKVQLDADKLANIGIYRFDPKDERRAALANTLLYYPDFGSEYTFKLDDKEFTTFVDGSLNEKSRLPIDRDGNKRTSPRLETASIGKPFNFTGTTYIFKLDGSRLQLEVAPEAVEMAPLPPDVSVGKPALKFTAKTMDGQEIEFPGSFAGKLVMLDCWATWCGPCIGEIPHMKEAYTQWHDKGFEILGVSFDSEGMEEKVQEFLKSKEIAWPQVYEGKGWEASVGLQYDVSGIPFVLLVDGDTGEILATAAQLRGPKLAEFIGKALEEKNK